MSANGAGIFSFSCHFPTRRVNVLASANAATRWRDAHRRDIENPRGGPYTGKYKSDTALPVLRGSLSHQVIFLFLMTGQAGTGEKFSFVRAKHFKDNDAFFIVSERVELATL